MSLNEDLLSEDPDSQAVEVDDDVFFDPYPDKDSNVVATEPDIITIGRGLRKDALKKEREALRDVLDEPI